jgi:hypothetical protein
MWFAIGVVTLALACLGFVFLRGNATWRGSMRVHGVEAKAGTHKGKLVSLAVGARTRSRLEFELKPETALDGFAKSVGLSVEGEIGHGRFDRALYLVADDPHVVQVLRADRALADALLDLFASGGQGVTKVKRIVCRAGMVRVECKCDAQPDDAERITQSVATPLLGVARTLGEGTATAGGDKLWWRAAILLAIASGLAVNGAFHGVRLFATKTPDTLDDTALWALSIPVALAIVAALVAATLVLLGRTSRAHLVLAEVLLVGGIGAVATAVCEVRDLNMEADSSEAVVHGTSIVDRAMHHGRKGGRTYTVTFAPFPGSDGPYRLKVSAGDYDRLMVGMPVAVRVREGWLGLAWLESYETAQ